MAALGNLRKSRRPGWSLEQPFYTDAARNANRIWKQMLAEYEQPPLDAATLEELDAFIDRRKAEIGKAGGAL